MSSGTSTGRANASAKRTKSINKSTRAGVLFPVARLHRYLKKVNPKTRVSVGASVYAAAVIEYLAAEVLELSGNAARDHRRSRVTPRHVFLAVSIDEELKKLLKNVTISQGGNLPYIHPFLLRNRNKPSFEATAKSPEPVETPVAVTNGETSSKGKKNDTTTVVESAEEPTKETTPESTTVIIKEVKAKKGRPAKATGAKKGKK